MSGERMLVVAWSLRFEASGEVVDDVEALARGVLGAERWPCYLEAADERELLTYLLSEAALLERRYAPRDGIEARPWLFERLRFKARDWRRSFYGRHGQHRTLGAGGLDDDSLDAGDGLGGGSHGAIGEVAGDRGDPGTDALGWLLEAGDRSLLREIAALGLGPPPRARARNEGARRALARLDEQRRRRVEQSRVRAA